MNLIVARFSEINLLLILSLTLFEFVTALSRHNS